MSNLLFDAWESGNPVEFSSPEEDVRRWRMLGWLTGDGGMWWGSAASWAIRG